MICKRAEVDPVPEDLEDGEPFTAATGLVEGEMIAHLLHCHALYMSNNGQVFDVIEVAL